MRLAASDLHAYYRPTPCELRIFLKERGEKEASPGPYEQVLFRLGQRHEAAHLASLGPFTDLSAGSFEERIVRTREAIAGRASVLYQPAFIACAILDGVECEIVGAPDFMISRDDGYLIRDSKISRRITDEDHPEILRQLELYGWLYEKTMGSLARALQVHAGTGNIEPVRYDGGVQAIQTLARIAKLKDSNSGEPYSPVGWTKCGGCSFYERCWPLAQSRRDPALLSDVDQNLAFALRDAGIDSYEALLARFDEVTLAEFRRPWGKRTQKVGARAASILRAAQVMISGDEFILETPRIASNGNFAIFDVEGLPPHLDELEKVYLWGLQVSGDAPGEYRPATADFGPEGDRKGWERFLANAAAIFEAHGDIPFVHWAPYERAKIDLYLGRFGDINGSAERVKRNLLDLLPITKQTAVLPLPSYSLKVIERYIGFKRSQDEYGGDWAMAKYIEAIEMEDPEARRQVMDAILTYNKEDLAATWAVLEWLRSKRKV